MAAYENLKKQKNTGTVAAYENLKKQKNTGTVAAYENLKKQKNTGTYLKNDSKGFRFSVKLRPRILGILLKMKYSKSQFKVITLIFVIVMFKNSYSTI